MNLEQARFNMIEQQIRPWNVLDSGVLELLSIVKREDFVPSAHRALAFANLEIPLPSGQCMLTPQEEARLLQAVAIQPGDKVLEIGSGSGYMAALLAHRAASVLSLECVGELAALARANLARAGIANVTVREVGVAELATGAPADAPFDVIVLSGSVAQVPHALLNQLRVKGRLVAIVGEEPVMCATLITRSGARDFRTEQPWDTLAPRLQGFGEPSRFTF